MPSWTTENGVGKTLKASGAGVKLFCMQTLAIADISRCASPAAGLLREAALLGYTASRAAAKDAFACGTLPFGTCLAFRPVMLIDAMSANHPNYFNEIQVFGSSLQTRSLSSTRCSLDSQCIYQSPWLLAYFSAMHMTTSSSFRQHENLGVGIGPADIS